MAAIQLLLRDDANRQALASVVDERHTAITDLDLQPADLYLVDDASLPEYQEALEAHKQDQAPVFCPVVLIRRDRTPITVELPNPASSKRLLVVNEEMTAPVGKQTLFQRIANLLARRRQTTELRDANERLEQFAHTLRHELRNPLTILNGYLDVAREGGDEEALERCQTAVNRMERLLEDTLAVLKGRDADLSREPVELPVACRSCWDLVSETEAQIEIATTQEISVDRDRLTQLLENLFRNAVEHGGADVTVTVGELDDGFYVEDDGPGIPEEERDTVFEEGYSTTGTGSGLGLAVVERVAEAHDWEARVTDGAAGGARFEFTGIESLTKSSMMD